jgi:hypothetical protein
MEILYRAVVFSLTLLALPWIKPADVDAAAAAMGNVPGCSPRGGGQGGHSAHLDLAIDSIGLRHTSR